MPKKTTHTPPVYQPLNYWALRHSVARQTAWKWASKGRIDGAIKVGRSWLVPEASAVPAHGKAGRPIATPATPTPKARHKPGTITEAAVK